MEDDIRCSGVCTCILLSRVLAVSPTNFFPHLKTERDLTDVS